MPAGSKYWISEGMLGKQITNIDFDGDGIIDHVSFSVTNKFLHPNHPLGWVRKITVSIDGVVVDDEAACFVLREQWIPLKYVPTIRDIWWNATESARIVVPSERLETGSTHNIKCNLDVSLMVHDKNIDRYDKYSRLYCELEENMVALEDNEV